MAKRYTDPVCDSFATPPSLQEQRILVSTMAYIIYDVMTEKVRDYKIHLSSSIDEPQVELPVATLHESNISLYRYGGFALHSLLNKYSHPVPPSDNHDNNTTSLHTILNQLKIKNSKEMDKLPSAIHHLNRGSLDLTKTWMLPYL